MGARNHGHWLRGPSDRDRLNACSAGRRAAPARAQQAPQGRRSRRGRRRRPRSGRRARRRRRRLAFCRRSGIASKLPAPTPTGSRRGPAAQPALHRRGDLSIGVKPMLFRIPIRRYPETTAPPTTFATISTDITIPRTPKASRNGTKGAMLPFCVDLRGVVGHRSGERSARKGRSEAGGVGMQRGAGSGVGEAVEHLGRARAAGGTEGRELGRDDPPRRRAGDRVREPDDSQRLPVRPGADGHSRADREPEAPEVASGCENDLAGLRRPASVLDHEVVDGAAGRRASDEGLRLAASSRRFVPSRLPRRTGLRPRSHPVTCAVRARLDALTVGSMVATMSAPRCVRTRGRKERSS